MSEGLNEFSVIEPVQIKPVLNTTLSATIAASIGVLHSKITKRKEELLMEALKQHGLPLDLLQEKRRFNPLVCETTQGEINTSTYYYNDGSINGLKLLSFIDKGHSAFVDSVENIEIHKLSFEYIIHEKK